MSTKKAIVFVDDEKDFHVISKIKFKRLIQSGELEMFNFHKPQEALEYIREHGHKLDAIFTDLKMGKLDGFTLIESIRQNHPHLPCYIISAFESANYKHRAERLKIEGYLEKPVDFDKLSELIQKLN